MEWGKYVYMRVRKVSQLWKRANQTKAQDILYTVSVKQYSDSCYYCPKQPE